MSSKAKPFIPLEEGKRRELMPSLKEIRLASIRRPVSQAIGTLLIVGFLIFIVGPLVVLLTWAFAKEWFYPALIPQAWTWSWWRIVLTTSHLGHSILLSFIFAPVVTTLSALICLPAAYAFARYSFPGRRWFMVSLFAANAFPKMGLYMSMAGLLFAFNLMGTFWGVVIVQLISTLVIMTWIPSAAFRSVPRELEEAARDVGARPWQVFWRVTLPIAWPGILVGLILGFLASLDEAQGTFLVGIPNYITMPVQMYTLVGHYPQQAAAVFAIILTLPSVILLLLVRRYIVGGTLAAGFRIR
ncbi:MAG: ABC transporter permease subunit [Firmicutes bacterium]|nr:ABC transporter permease subunit [Bacillota bacterium]